MSADTQSCWAVVPAAGIGSRMAADVPKQYLSLRGQTLLEHSVGALLECAAIKSVMVALHPDDLYAATLSLFKDERVLQTTGGATRAESVLCALKALAAVADPQDWVLVHDAARPCVTVGEIMSLLDSVRESGTGGILAEPVVDTIKLAGEDGRVDKTLDRDRMWRAQTPQMFRLGLLQNALEAALASGATVTDEASAMEMAGHPVQLVRGSASNLKITVPDDITLAEFYLQGRDKQC